MAFIGISIKDPLKTLVKSGMVTAIRIPSPVQPEDFINQINESNLVRHNSCHEIFLPRGYSIGTGRIIKAFALTEPGEPPQWECLNSIYRHGVEPPSSRRRWIRLFETRCPFGSPGDWFTLDDQTFIINNVYLCPLHQWRYKHSGDLGKQLPLKYWNFFSTGNFAADKNPLTFVLELKEANIPRDGTLRVYNGPEVFGDDVWNHLNKEKPTCS